MAQITLTIPTPVASRVLDAFSNLYGYNASSGQTQLEFAKANLVNYIMGVVRDYEARQAVQTANIAAINKVNTDIVIT